MLLYPHLPHLALRFWRVPNEVSLDDKRLQMPEVKKEETIPKVISKEEYNLTLSLNYIQKNKND